MKTDIQVTVVQINKNHATLIFEDGQSITWPIASLPNDVKVGDTVVLELHSKTSQQAREQSIAKTILNEILSDK